MRSSVFSDLSNKSPEGGKRLINRASLSSSHNCAQGDSGLLLGLALQQTNILHTFEVSSGFDAVSVTAGVSVSFSSIM